MVDNKEDLLYRNFWCKIIAYAIDDARGTSAYLRNIKRIAGSGDGAWVLEKSREWLLENGGQFEYVCSMLGLNADAIRIQAEREGKSKEMARYLYPAKSKNVKRVDL